MKLRTRLLLILVGLLAFGLLATDIFTYFQLQSFLVGKVDQELTQASPTMLREVLRAAQGTPNLPNPFGGPGANGASSLQPGSVGELVTTNGEVLGTVHITYGGTNSSIAPNIPKSILKNLGNQTTSTNSFTPSTATNPSTGEYITTGATSGSGNFRVLIVPVGQGLLLVEAFPLNDVYSTLESLRNLEILVSVGVLLVLGLGGYYLVVLGLRPLEKVKHATREIAAGNLEKRVQIDSTKTEIGQLSLDFNEMIDRIEGEFKLRAATEARLRRFVSDASHELRTPLSFLRGHAELFRQGAISTPEELASSMKRIEEQAKRMGRLVDELLLLARFDEGSPVVLVPIDLRLIAHDAAADARAMAPERNVKVNAVEEVFVMAEETGLRQVVGNMVRNAIVHTPPGTSIELEVTKTHEAGLLKVIDFGPGIAPDKAQSIFDRFYRADPSRSRDSGGSGLGLAIVATIIQAYGGTFGVEPTLNNNSEISSASGATFWVSLPLKNS